MLVTFGVTLLLHGTGIIHKRIRTYQKLKISKIENTNQKIQLPEPILSFHNPYLSIITVFFYSYPT